MLSRLSENLALDFPLNAYFSHCETNTNAVNYYYHYGPVLLLDHIMLLMG